MRQVSDFFGLTVVEALDLSKEKQQELLEARKEVALKCMADMIGHDRWTHTITEYTAQEMSPLYACLFRIVTNEKVVE